MVQIADHKKIITAGAGVIVSGVFGVWLDRTWDLFPTINWTIVYAFAGTWGVLWLLYQLHLIWTEHREHQAARWRIPIEDAIDYIAEQRFPNARAGQALKLRRLEAACVLQEAFQSGRLTVSGVMPTEYRRDELPKEYWSAGATLDILRREFGDAIEVVLKHSAHGRAKYESLKVDKRKIAALFPPTPPADEGSQSE